MRDPGCSPSPEGFGVTSRNNINRDPERFIITGREFTEALAGIFLANQISYFKIPVNTHAESKIPKLLCH